MSNDSVAQSPQDESSQVSAPEATHRTECGGPSEGCPPFLVTFVASPIFNEPVSRAYRAPWSAVNKTRYHRLLAFLEYWESHHFSIIRLDLTTAPGGRSELLGDHFEELLARIARREKRKVQFWRLTTREGLGVIHSLLACPGDRSLFVDFEWLSAQWLSIHGAPRVYVKRYQASGGSRERVSKYLVSQYIAGQEAGVRLSASYRETFGFPLEATWALFRDGAVAEGRKDAVDRWRGLLRGEDVSPREGITLNLGFLRGPRLRIKTVSGWGPLYPARPPFPFIDGGPARSLVALAGPGGILAESGTVPPICGANERSQEGDRLK